MRECRRRGSSVLMQVIRCLERPLVAMTEVQGASLSFVQSLGLRQGRAKAGGPWPAGKLRYGGTGGQASFGTPAYNGPTTGKNFLARRRRPLSMIRFFAFPLQRSDDGHSEQTGRHPFLDTLSLGAKGTVHARNHQKDQDNLLGQSPWCGTLLPRLLSREHDPRIIVQTSKTQADADETRSRLTV